MESLTLTLLLILSVTGIVVTFIVTLARSSGRGLYSAFNASCSSFIDHSLFRFFGIPLDLLGGIYYIFILSFSIAVWFWGDLFWGFLMIAILFGAFFSFYFIMIQVFAVKDLCEWTIVGALVPIMNLGLFLVLVPSEAITVWASEVHAVVSMSVTGFAVLGALLAVVSFFLFVFFMDDLQMSKKEARVLSFLSDGAVLVAVSILCSGIAIVWVNEIISEIQVLSLALGVALVTAICEFTKVSRIRPALVMVSVKKSKMLKKEKELLKRLAFGVEGISLVSWLCLAFLFWYPAEEVAISQVMGMYVLLIIIAFILSQLVIPDPYENNR